MSFKMISYKAEVLSAMEEAKEMALEAIGAKCAGYASLLAPVDTGRLRNSITWATDRNDGRQYSYTDDDGLLYVDFVRSGSDKDTVYVGTNVEYAIYQELGTSGMKYAQPYLTPAVMNHIDEYKRLAASFFRNAMK